MSALQTRVLGSWHRRWHKLVYLHNGSREIQGHERVGGSQGIKNAADVIQAWYVVREPGYEPAERKEGGNAAVLNMLVQLFIALNIRHVGLAMQVPYVTVAHALYIFRLAMPP